MPFIMDKPEFADELAQALKPQTDSVRCITHWRGDENPDVHYLQQRHEFLSKLDIRQRHFARSVVHAISTISVLGAGWGNSILSTRCLGTNLADLIIDSLLAWYSPARITAK